MANERFKALTQFYREFIKPDLDEIRSASTVLATKAELVAYMDDSTSASDRVDSDIQSLRAAPSSRSNFSHLVQPSDVSKVTDAVDQKLDRMALRSELVELKDQVAHLTERIAQLEKALN